MISPNGASIKIKGLNSVFISITLIYFILILELAEKINKLYPSIL